MAFTRVNYSDDDVIIVQGATSVFNASVTVTYNNDIMAINGNIVLSGILNAQVLQVSIPNPTGKLFSVIHGAAQVGRRGFVGSHQVVLYGDPALMYANSTNNGRIRFDEHNSISGKYSADYGELIISCVVKI